ncbi:TraR/DksA C4-type zinc finger protein [Streptomyces tsukubensis]|uniref:Zinc finger DksA/TraR C4-type domain-containing protein n=1 Tax=Streptomyces tsukubensis TaxID=83656 RepID=A0A1V4A768_9ACTN|nr:TraR/DksA C4-type zinc finger protein [Streptomyces tsukubensis]OON77620.1 hypothetical protein B1H18_17945 [Streptomyces tsukubensis]QFR93124.1 DNA-binding protein [Streptomyces tsukubensis]
MVAKKTAGHRRASSGSTAAAEDPAPPAEEGPAHPEGQDHPEGRGRATSARGTGAGSASAPSEKEHSEARGKEHSRERNTGDPKSADGPAAGAKKGAGRTAAANAATGEAADGQPAAAETDAANAADETGAQTVVSKKSPATTTATKDTVSGGAADSGGLAIRPGEEPWTPEEVTQAREELHSEVERLREEIGVAEASLAGLMRDSADGAGDDEADTGTKNITREHEMSLAAQSRDMLVQTERALQRLDAGTYGVCENCGKPVGKARMQAFPRATLCVECKQKQERRN